MSLLIMGSIKSVSFRLASNNPTPLNEQKSSVAKKTTMSQLKSALKKPKTAEQISPSSQPQHSPNSAPQTSRSKKSVSELKGSPEIQKSRNSKDQDIQVTKSIYLQPKSPQIVKSNAKEQNPQVVKFIDAKSQSPQIGKSIDAKAKSPQVNKYSDEHASSDSSIFINQTTDLEPQSHHLSRQRTKAEGTLSTKLTKLLTSNDLASFLKHTTDSESQDSLIEKQNTTTLDNQSTNLNQATSLNEQSISPTKLEEFLLLKPITTKNKSRSKQFHSPERQQNHVNKPTASKAKTSSSKKSPSSKNHTSSKKVIVAPSEIPNITKQSVPPTNQHTTSKKSTLGRKLKHDASAKPTKSILRKGYRVSHDRTVKFLESDIVSHEKNERKRKEKKEQEEIKYKTYSSKENKLSELLSYTPYTPSAQDRLCFIYDPKEYLHKKKLQEKKSESLRLKQKRLIEQDRWETENGIVIVDSSLRMIPAAPPSSPAEQRETQNKKSDPKIEFLLPPELMLTASQTEKFRKEKENRNKSPLEQTRWDEFLRQHKSRSADNMVHVVFQALNERAQRANVLKEISRKAYYSKFDRPTPLEVELLFHLSKSRFPSDSSIAIIDFKDENPLANLPTTPLKIQSLGDIDKTEYEDLPHVQSYFVEDVSQNGSRVSYHSPKTDKVSTTPPELSSSSISQDINLTITNQEKVTEKTMSAKSSLSSRTGRQRTKLSESDMSDMISNVAETDSLIRYKSTTKTKDTEDASEKMRDRLYPMYIPTISSIVMEKKDQEQKLKQSLWGM